MRIDWTQTLIGALATADEARSAAAERDGGGAGLPLTGLMVARLSGVLAAVAAMGLVIAVAALPSGAGAVHFADLVALAGLISAGVASLFAMAHFGARRGAPAALCGFIALPFAFLAGLSAPALVLMATLLVMDCAMMSLSGGQAPLRRSLVVLAGAILLTGLVATMARLGEVILLAVAFVPFAMTAMLKPAARNAEPARRESRAELAALTGMARRGPDSLVLATDIVGSIDAGAETDFQRELVARDFPEGSLVTAILIADRVSLLNALSRAIHDGEASPPLALRLRREPAGAGYPVPPRFEPVTCHVFPAPGIEGRAIVAIEPAPAEPVAEPAPRATAGTAPDAALVLRALHDCNAPFNAGLGFLEMIADPRLEPRDIATWRDFAAEAHKAITEAHRNSVLMGRWLRARDADEAAAAPIQPAKLVQDAIRALNLRDAMERGEIRVSGEDLPPARLPLASARFAMEVLLRGAHQAGPVRIEMARHGADLVFACRHEAEDGPEPDAFQRAVEQAAAQGGIRFQRGAEGVSLHFAEAFLAAETITAPAGMADAVRLAS